MMTITLYINNAEDNRMDKTAYLVERATLTGTIRGGTSVENPTILLELPYDEDDEILAGDENLETADGIDIADIPGENTLIKFNYAYIPEFHRYYFVNDIAVGTNRLYAVSMKVDTLMSFKENLLELSAIIERNEFDYDPSINDERRPFTSELTMDLQELDAGSRKNFSFSTLDNTNTPELCYSLVTFVDSAKRDQIAPVSAYPVGSEPWNEEVDSPYLGLPDIKPSKSALPQLEIPYLMRLPSMCALQYVFQFDADYLSYIIGACVFPFNLPYETRSDDSYLVCIGSKTPIPSGENSKQLVNRHGRFLPYMTLFEYQMPDDDDFVSLRRATYDIYIPYYGWMPLDYNAVRGHRISLVYSLSLVDGSGNAFIYDTDAEKVIHSVQVQVGTPIDFSTTNYKEANTARRAVMLNTIMSMVAGAVSGGLGAGVFGAVGGASMALVKGAISAMNIFDHGQVSYSKTADALMNPQKAYLRTRKPIPTFEDGSDDFSRYAHSQGLPLMQERALSELEGFTKVDSIHLDNVPCFAGERIELDTLLRSGVLL